MVVLTLRQDLLEDGMKKADCEKDDDSYEQSFLFRAEVEDDDQMAMDVWLQVS